MKKFKIVLINTGIEDCFKENLRKQYLFPPYGLLSIASMLNSHGYNVILFDFFSQSINRNQFITKLKQESESILAVGITTYTESFHLAISIAKLAKQVLPNSKIILGGVHVSTKPNEGLASDIVDFIVRGEGESKIIALLEYIKYHKYIDLINIIGISYKNKAGQIIHNDDGAYIKNIDFLPFPSFFLNSEYYISSDTISIITSRGCPGKCIFCASREFNGKKYRMHSAFWLFALIYHYYHTIKKFNAIDFLDDTFTVNKKRLKQLNEYFKYNKCKYLWSCKSRTDNLDERTINLLYQGGCRSIHLGIESGDQRILNSIDKNINHENNLNVIKLCYKYSIMVECSFMIGLPEDTKETIDKTLIMASEIINSNIGRAFISIATPFPGTKMYINSNQYGIIFLNHNWKNYTTRKPIYYTQNFSIDDLRNAYYCFNFDKNKLERNNIISSSDLSNFRNGIKSWINEVIKCKTNVQ